MKKTIKVFIIDDSALTRAVLSKIITTDPRIEVIGTAADPVIAQKKLARLKPDVITLDIEMPKMDGLTFLNQFLKSKPVSTIVISGNSPKSSLNAIKALEAGAVEIIEKPNISTPEKLREVSNHIIASIKTANTAKSHNYSETIVEAPAKNVAEKVTPTKNSGSAAKNIVLVGSSTGGPDLLRFIFSKVRNQEAGIVIAQHMPPMFTQSFANRLDEFSSLKVKEAADGVLVEKGSVYVLPGDYHGEIIKNGRGYKLSLNKNDKVNRHRPSVDVLFKSGLNVPPSDLKAIQLTGMGDDGAKGMKVLHDKGVETVAQDARSCVVFGMPKKAIELGGVTKISTPQQIIEELNKQ